MSIIDQDYWLKNNITIDSSTVSSSSDSYTITIPTTSGTTVGTISANDSSYYTFSGSNGINNNAAGTVCVPEGGDFKIGERSLKDFMDKVEQRLAILRPNEALEARWDELKELGDRYRKLEKELQEKEKMWDILKKD